MISMNTENWNARCIEKLLPFVIPLARAVIVQAHVAQQDEDVIYGYLVFPDNPHGRSYISVNIAGQINHGFTPLCRFQTRVEI